MKVKEFQSQYVSVGGEVNSLGRTPIRGRMRLVDSLLESGGFKASASAEVLITRTDGTFDDGQPSITVGRCGCRRRERQQGFARAHCDVARRHRGHGRLRRHSHRDGRTHLARRGRRARHGKCCVVGCDSLRIDYASDSMEIGDRTIKQGEWLTIEGTTGEVFEGRVPTIAAELSDDFRKLLGWADKIRKLAVRTNADTPADAATAVAFGAEGIGLCRTEHMFFEGERIDAVREMILATDLAGREKALEKLLPYQRRDFVGIFEAIRGRPVTIRLLDPPLHEFLPHDDAEYEALAKQVGIDAKKLEAAGEALHEFNPMLGHRGV